ncbi:hypothetical protein [Treponema endosymbiont of Eucomonympha sp.]|uniref:hypothetical protein n=1 Tax=Treponema endosymbiont of Eucomonympha sp. TaxID=1580831 RepID=UPI001EE74CA4|nr:hypothetical protein [Treponema endosymbiont of Eucomonympha sp.]
MFPLRRGQSRARALKFYIWTNLKCLYKFATNQTQYGGVIMFLTKAEEQHLNGIFLRNKQGSIQLTDGELAMIKTYNGLKKSTSSPGPSLYNSVKDIIAKYP